MSRGQPTRAKIFRGKEPAKLHLSEHYCAGKISWQRSKLTIRAYERWQVLSARQNYHTPVKKWSVLTLYMRSSCFEH